LEAADLGLVVQNDNHNYKKYCHFNFW